MPRSKGNNIADSLKEREIKGEAVGRRLASEKHTTPDFINRLGLLKELHGHEGCVNCLDWNQSGTTLASGSDDQTVILWCGGTGRKLTQLSTHHEGNIFSVKFVPGSCDSQIVTGAQDSRVCLLDVEKETAVQSATIHIGRVKRLAVAPDTPGVFWSAAEDGTVMQWDTREKWSTGDTNVLINLVKHVSKAEVKCIAVNPCKPELIGIGANDPYIRIYDRRKLTLQKLTEDAESISNWERRTRIASSGGMGDDTPVGAVNYFVPGHLPLLENKYKSNLRPLVCTYLSFSNRGTDLITHLGGEHIYYYDQYRLTESCPQPSMLDTLAVMRNCDINAAAAIPAVRDLPKEVEELKASANSDFGQEQYTAAISQYNVALSLWEHPVLYANRAAAFIKRKYCGDIYAAMRDCLSALRLDSANVKALLRLAKCLFELEWVEEAVECLKIFRERHPGHLKSQVFRQLEKEVGSAAQELSKRHESLDPVDETDEEEPGGTSAKKRREDSDETEEASEIQVMDDGDDDQDSEDGADEEVAAAAAGQGEDGQSSSGSRRRTDAEIREEVRRVFHYNMERDSGGLSPGSPGSGGRSRSYKKRLSKQEVIWRKNTIDYTSRFIGACNTTTDIKEANFFGSDCQFIVAGSDDGRILIWDKTTTNLLKVLDGDSSTVNCVQGHPSAPLLASSGIDAVVRLWDPRPEDGTEEPRLVKDTLNVIEENQTRMTQDPFEYFMSTAPLRDEDIQCRPS